MKARERTSFTRNGLPPSRDYVYRGTGTDQGPNLSAEQLAPYVLDYSHWLPGFSRGSTMPQGSKDACTGCGYRRGAANCRAICGRSR